MFQSPVSRTPHPKVTDLEAHLKDGEFNQNSGKFIRRRLSTLENQRSALQASVETVEDTSKTEYFSFNKIGHRASESSVEASQGSVESIEKHGNYYCFPNIETNQWCFSLTSSAIKKACVTLFAFTITVLPIVVKVALGSTLLAALAAMWPVSLAVGVVSAGVAAFLWSRKGCLSDKEPIKQNDLNI